MRTVWSWVGSLLQAYVLRVFVSDTVTVDLPFFAVPSTKYCAAAGVERAPPSRRLRKLKTIASLHPAKSLVSVLQSAMATASSAEDFRAAIRAQQTKRQRTTHSSKGGFFTAVAAIVLAKMPQPQPLAMTFYIPEPLRFSNLKRRSSENMTV